MTTRHQARLPCCLALLFVPWLLQLGSSAQEAFLGLRQPTSRPKASLHALVGDDGTTFERFEKDPSDKKVRGERKASGSSGKKTDLEPVDDTWYEGSIKSYSTQDGFGFIHCDELFNKHQADVFLHKRQVDTHLGSRATRGDQVRFLLGVNQAGKPQARNVERRVGSHWVDFSKVYVGSVKDYREEKGFGFIVCPETHYIFQSDIFLHKNEVEKNNLSKGSRVTFSIQVNKNNRPQARSVERLVPTSFSGERSEEETEMAVDA
ncbi:unnamed protein product [Cladocopium goreaui]|uniref:CSD domain-containing protein n=1 Tax=Cladocopium goreaui TaxID=2562237 RepID=A0A9P1D335_9DINO|nr:unnamed protein product [Cladocopium goreaui]